MAEVQIRQAAVAGMFYTSDPDELRAQVSYYLGLSEKPEWRPRAIIVPHAGFIYSGKTAGAAWACTASRRSDIKRVLLLGPNHRVPLNGIATSPAKYWQSPLGNVELDIDAINKLQRLPYVRPVALAHLQEHCLEVQLPFIQQLFPHAKLIPLLVGESTPDQVAELLSPFWGDDTTLIVISSDLSHYHDYMTAKELDGETSKQIEQCHYEAIDSQQACGCRAIAGLLKIARENHAVVTTLDLCNSGDTAGDKARVVGYGAYGIH